MVAFHEVLWHSDSSLLLIYDHGQPGRAEGFLPRYFVVSNTIVPLDAVLGVATAIRGSEYCGRRPIQPQYGRPSESSFPS